MPSARFPYAPAPESRSVVNLKPAYGLFIDGDFVDPLDGGSFKTEDPSTQEVLAEVSSAGPADVDRAIAAARRAQEEVWGPMPGKERAKYLFRIARIVQERSRELAVLESLDNGKPIKESRDVDIPLAAAHFFYYAGWADKLAYAGLGPGPPARRRGRTGHTLELPTSDGGLEARPCSGDREHLRAKTRRDHASVGAPAGRNPPTGRTAAGRRQHPHRSRRHRRVDWWPTPA